MFVITNSRNRALKALLALLLLAGQTFGAVPFNAGISSLPRAPILTSKMRSHKTFFIRSTLVRDTTGKVLDIPAYIVHLQSGAGGWVPSNSTKIPAFSTIIPPSLTNKISLYYFRFPGWMVIPRGWVLIDAAEGGDGSSSLSFIAPHREGLRKVEVDWMTVSSEGGCWGCMYLDAAGIVPGARKEFEKTMGLPLPQLNPTPDAIDVINKCTATIKYRIPNSPPVRGLVYLGAPSDRDYYETQLYLALPKKDEKVANLIFETFQEELLRCGRGP